LRRALGLVRSRGRRRRSLNTWRDPPTAGRSRCDPAGPARKRGATQSAASETLRPGIRTRPHARRRRSWMRMESEMKCPWALPAWRKAGRPLCRRLPAGRLGRKGDPGRSGPPSESRKSEERGTARANASLC
jgi:hypothetical protein